MLSAIMHRLYRHMVWADREVLGVLENLETPEESADRLMAHIVAAEYIWGSRLLGRDIGDFTPWTVLSREERRAMADQMHREFLEIVDGLTEEQLQNVVEYRTTKGAEMRSTWETILLQVASHGSYHRGQIAAILSKRDLPIPATDYLIYTLQPPGD